MDHGISLNKFVLQDLKLPPSVNEIFQNNNLEGVKVATPDSNEILITTACTLYWYKGDLLSRKLIYSSKILNAFFTQFKNDTHKKALVILLRDTANVYYADGKSYTLSFPFKIVNGIPFPNGVLLEKENIIGSNNISFLTMLEPMAEFGTVISSTTSNISSLEKLVYFPNSKSSLISITLNENEGVLNFYRSRFLNRQNHDNTASTVPHNPNDQVSRRKASRKASASIGSVSQEDRMVDDEISMKMDKRRGVSYSESLSIDRMALHDFYSNNTKSSEPFSNIISGSSSFDPTVLRKDCILSRFHTTRCDGLRNLKIDSMKVEESHEVIFVRSTKILKFFIFDCSNSSFPPKLTKELDFSDSYRDLTILEQLPGFILLVHKGSCDLTLYNPLLSIELSVFQSSTEIQEILSSKNSNVIFKNTQNEILKMRLHLNPNSEVVASLLDSLKYLTNPFSFNYIKIIWIYSFTILKKEWESFVLTIIAIILPISIEDAHLDDSNPVVKILRNIRPIQLKLAKDQFSLYQLAPNIVLALHLICEDMKLNIFNKKLIIEMKMLMGQLVHWIGWNDHWTLYYEQKSFEINKLIKFPVPQILQFPPNILKSLNSLFEETIIPYLTYSQLSQESEAVDEKITPRSFYVLRLFEAIISPDFIPVDVVTMMVEFNISMRDLETYPIGILIPLKESIVFCQENLHLIDPLLEKKLYQLIDRKDLFELLEGPKRINNKERSSNNTINLNQHGQSKDMHQIVSAINEYQEPIAPLEYDRFQITKLIFNEDRRFYEISKMLQTFQTQTVVCDWIGLLPESESLGKRKTLAALVALRTLTIPLGRSIMLYSSKEPLITEKFPIPKFTFSIQILPDNISVNHERDSINPNCLEWGNFHNGAATALTISKNSKGISGSWIVFNRPPILNAQHGGFLLGLGLNGHMKNLEEWNIYNYLGPKHIYTSIGLLLGMSASLRGTQNVKLTKVLSVHIVALLPQGASDLIVSSSVQTAGLIGIGLLYLETQHRRMSEILLSQINGTILIDEKQVPEESYRMAAGISLGYINLGKGDDLKGLNDTHVVDKLLAIAVAMKDVQTDESFDKSMNGSLIALMFIYLKSNNAIIAKKLQIPTTDQLLDYFRPDVLLLRVLAKNMIMWYSISNSVEWVNSQIPHNLLHEKSYTDIHFHNIVAGLCLSISLKYASTGDLKARNTVMRFYDKLTSLSKNYQNSESFDTKMLQNSLSRVQVILGICLSLIMASTGDLETFRRLRVLHGDFEIKEESDNTLYGKFMAVNMALGFLFMAGGQFAISTDSNFAIAALITSIYPIFPKTDDTFQPEVHLQALRHFWSMAVEPRCLIVRDVETKKPLTINVSLSLKNGEEKIVSTPNLIPNLSLVKEIKLLDVKDYFQLKVSNLNILLENNLNLYVYKKSNVKPLQKAIELILEEMNFSFDDKTTGKGNDSLVNLSIFDGFLKEDLHNILNAVPVHQTSSGNNSVSFPNFLNASDSNIIDKQIELTQIVQQPKSIEDLWNLKLIFSYYDKLLNNEDVYYLSTEYVDDLKMKLWSFAKQL